MNHRIPNNPFYRGERGRQARYLLGNVIVSNDRILTGRRHIPLGCAEPVQLRGGSEIHLLDRLLSTRDPLEIEEIEGHLWNEGILPEDAGIRQDLDPVIRRECEIWIEWKLESHREKVKNRRQEQIRRRLNASEIAWRKEQEENRRLCGLRPLLGKVHKEKPYHGQQASERDIQEREARKSAMEKELDHLFTGLSNVVWTSSTV